jgi:hypothetical protein
MFSTQYLLPVAVAHARLIGCKNVKLLVLGSIDAILWMDAVQL